MSLLKLPFINDGSGPVRGISPISPPADISKRNTIPLPAPAEKIRGAGIVAFHHVASPEGVPEDILPFGYRSGRNSIRVDPIPSSSFGGSLANLLDRKAWESIRQDALSESGGLCILCGADEGRRSVDCHEIWTYEAGDIQKLSGILPVCRACHQIFHPGLAQMRGELSKSLSRLAWVNRWTLRQSEQYHARIMQVWLQRSRRSWTLDLDLVSGYQLRLKPGFEENETSGFRDPRKPYSQPVKIMKGQIEIT